MANTKRIKKFFLLFDTNKRFYGTHTYKLVCRKVQISTVTLEYLLKHNHDWNNWKFVIRDKFVIFRKENFDETVIEELTKGQIDWRFSKFPKNKGGTNHKLNYKYKEDIIILSETDELVIKKCIED